MLDRKLVIVLVALFVMMTAGIRSLPGPAAEQPENETQSRTAKLSDRISSQVEGGNLEGAEENLGKLSDLIRVDPAASRKLHEGEKLLYREAVRAVEEDRRDEATAILKDLLIIDPTFREAQELLGAIEREEGSRSQAVTEPAGAAPAVAPTPLPNPHDLGPDTDALALVPTQLAGYRVVQHGRLDRPNLAGATYALSGPLEGEIDRMLVKVAKLEDFQGAADELTAHRGQFSEEAQVIEVNGHLAHAGLKPLSEDGLFPSLAAIAWTRGQFFFSVEILPLPSTSDARKIAIAKAAVQAWGF